MSTSRTTEFLTTHNAEELRGEALWLAFLGFACIAFALARAEGWTTAAWIGAGLALGVTACGVWRAHEWARLAGGATTGLLCFATLVALVVGAEELGVGTAGHVLLQGVSCFILLRPATRRSFAAARERRKLSARGTWRDRASTEER